MSTLQDDINVACKMGKYSRTVKRLGYYAFVGGKEIALPPEENNTFTILFSRFCISRWKGTYIGT